LGTCLPKLLEGGFLALDHAPCDKRSHGGDGRPLQIRQLRKPLDRGVLQSHTLRPAGEDLDRAQPRRRQVRREQLGGDTHTGPHLLSRLGLFTARLLDRLREPPEQLLEAGQQAGLLVNELLVKAGGGDSGPPRDVANRHRRIPPLRAHLRHRRDQPFALVALDHLPGDAVLPSGQPSGRICFGPHSQRIDTAPEEPETYSGSSGDAYSYPSPNVTYSPPAPEEPTAVQAVVEEQETPEREAVVLPSGLGEAWAAHSLPFQAWTRVLLASLPTARQKVDDLQETSCSGIAPFRPVLESVQALPFQAAAKGFSPSFPV